MISKLINYLAVLRQKTSVLLLVSTIGAAATIGCGSWLSRLFEDDDSPFCRLSMVHIFVCASIQFRSIPVRKPICPPLCSRGFCQNGFWINDQSSPTCGRNGASNCQTCSPNGGISVFGLDALKSSDVDGPTLRTYSPSSGTIGHLDPVTIQVSETLAVNGATATGSLAGNGSITRVINGDDLRTVVEVSPVSEWPTGHHSIAIKSDGRS